MVATLAVGSSVSRRSSIATNAGATSLATSDPSGPTSSTKWAARSPVPALSSSTFSPGTIAAAASSALVTVALVSSMPAEWASQEAATLDQSDAVMMITYTFDVVLLRSIQ